MASKYLETKWRQAFKAFDVNNDGFLTRSDYERIAEHVSLKTNASPTEAERTREEWVKWFRYLQPDPSVEKVDEQRYLVSCAELYKDVEHHKMLVETCASDLFDRIDFDADGLISPEELAIFYESLGVTNRDFIRKVFNQIDGDGDGFIEREELIEVSVRHFTNPDPIEGYSIIYDIPNRDSN